MSNNTLIKNNKPINKGIAIGLLIGITIGSFITFGIYSVLTPNSSEQHKSPVSSEQQPAYWVAPMDANYKRDKPGKSPMGMDLVPVYVNGNNEVNEGPGTIRISSDVVNNLGVRTTTASYQLLQTEINTVGYINYNEDKLVHIHPRVQGWIEKLYIKAIGDPVKKGQALYEIYSPELVNAQEEFLLALERKNSRLISAAHNRLQALQLPEQTIITLKQTRQVQQNITFYAPQKGVLENLNIREGFFVKPGSTLMSIVDLSEVWVEAEVFERQAGQVKTNTPVTMTLDYLPGKSWQGKVNYIYPTLDAKTRTVKVRLRFNNDEGVFKPNMFAQIAIHTKGDKNALLIPKEALIRTGNQDRVVLALGEGSFKSVAVKVGRYDSSSVEILEGLSEGEEVVSSAQFLLDSESSKSSDFKRMNHDDNDSDTMNTMSEMDMSQGSEDDSAHSNNSTSSTPSSATVTGTINSLMIDHGMINISRAAIEKWNRPAATIDFITADGVNLAGFNQGDQVIFTFEIRAGNFVIVEIAQHSDNEANASLSKTPAIDHSSH